MTERADIIHYARVLLQQSRHFTARHRGWSFTLLAWAGRARRHAAATVRPVQMEMF